MPIAAQDMPKTRDQGIEKALSWLDKALKLEADNKSSGMVDRALQRAVEYENAAFELPA